jgi:hypothetical protein
MSLLNEMKFTGLLHKMMPIQFKTFGTLVAYRRREIVIANIPAIPSSPDSLLKRVSADVRAKSETSCFIVETSRLKVNGEPLIPRSGDRITAGEKEYEITADETKQCFRPMDSEENYLRIFVKKVSGPLGGTGSDWDWDGDGNNGGHCDCPQDEPMTNEDVDEMTDNIFG